MSLILFFSAFVCLVISVTMISSIPGLDIPDDTRYEIEQYAAKFFAIAITLAICGGISLYLFNC